MPPALPPLALLACLLLTPLLAACSAEADDAADAAADSALHLEVTVTGDGPTLGDNEVFVEVSDPEGAPVSNAVVTVVGWMPAHGHGSPSPAEVTEVSKGRYRAFPVICHMPGAWTVTVTAQAGEDTGEVVLRWSIDG